MNGFDPLADERFPNRPQHPDFWRLSEIILQMDGDTTEGKQEFEEQIAKNVDVRSATYMAEQRSMFAMSQVVTPIMGAYEIQTLLAVMWLEGFLSGARFQQRGGKQ